LLFVKEKIAVQQVSSGHFVYSPANTIPAILHTHISFISYQCNSIYVVILASGAVVKYKPSLETGNQECEIEGRNQSLPETNQER
jgi:hypothetical protein